MSGRSASVDQRIESASPLDPGRLVALHPLARIGAAALLGLAALVSLDAVTSGLVIATVVVSLLLARVSVVDLVRRSWPVGVSALGVGVANGLVGDATVAESAALSVRVVALALPGIAVALTLDPTALADALVQQARVSPRFAYGALAALRMLPLMQQEWSIRRRARRARGLDDGPLADLRAFPALVAGLFVGAIRRGTALANAMEARGFDAGVERSVARPQRWRGVDTAVLGASAAAAAACVAASAWAGTLRLLGSG